MSTETAAVWLVHSSIWTLWFPPVFPSVLVAGMKQQADVHLEADIHAMKGDENSFGRGDCIPYLVITYRIAK